MRRRLVCGAATSVLAIVLQSTPVAAVAGDSGEIEAVVVTAQKRAEVLTKVPISAMAIDRTALARQGVQGVADIARLAPGVTLQGSDDVGNVNVAIRGIISTVGAATTGVYIDDVPVQVRQNSAVWSNPYPKVFDLDRVEVLRGPQGTLFGGGSEGGALRFITPEASLTKASGFARAELATTVGGGLSWEVGGAYGGPIIEDKLGFRASAWRREDGGYADRIDPATGAKLGDNVNSSDSTALRLGLKIAPTSRLVFTPAIYYQDVEDKDKGLFWESAGTYAIASKIPQPTRDHFVLATTGAEYDFKTFTVKSISSYLYRTVRSEYDSTSYELSNLMPDSGISLPIDPNYLVVAHYRSTQQSYSQEFRATSETGPDARLSWVGGLFYQHTRSGYDPKYQDNNFNELANYLSIYDGQGPGDSLSYFGEAPIDGIYTYVDHFVSEESDLAAFGDATVVIAPGLKASAGVRVSRSSFSYRDTADGPWGPGVLSSQSGSQSETPVTPRFNLSYDISPRQMAYVSVAKGYRIGGANQPVPSSSCAEDLGALGLTSAPSAYNSDSLWSYEAGLKGRFFGNAVMLESSLYWIDWSRIQQSINLVKCGYNYIGNLGEAVSRGFDVQAEWAVTPHLVLSGTAGLTDAHFTKTLEQDGQLLAKKGDSLATPAWTATAAAEYRFTPWSGANGYSRLDYQFASAYDRSGSADVFGSDPLLRKAPAVHDLSMRLGVRFKGWDTAIYANNLLDAHTSLFRYRDNVSSYGFRDERLRPLTVGVSTQYTY
jgi:iron complex outermembrane recepter protein